MNGQERLSPMHEVLGLAHRFGQHIWDGLGERLTYMYDNRQVACNLYSPKNLAQYKAVGKTVEQIIA